MEKDVVYIQCNTAAKSRQSCLTLHDPMDYSLPGSSVHGISQARVLEWGDIAFSNVILLSHKKKKKEWNYAIYSNMNGPRDYHIK